MTSKRILLPVDGSRFAEASLPTALALAERMDAELELVTVYFDEPAMTEWDVPTAELEAFHSEYVADAARRIGEVSATNVTTTVIGGPVGDALEKHVASTEPELVVMSTHGRGPISRAWLGSVADRMLRHIEQPILLVRPEDSGAVNVAERPTFGRILIALDGSERAEAILPLAKQIGRAFEASFTLYRAVPPYHASSPYLPHTIIETREATELGESNAREYLEQKRTEFETEGLDAQAEVGIAVQPASGLIRHACAAGSDLIAIATHGRGGLPRLVLGSVADKVVRGSPVPVLAVRPGKN